MIAATLLVPLFAFYARTPMLLLTLGPLLGFFAHGYFSLFGAMLAELFPTRIRAGAQGFCYNGGRLASAAAPFAIGAASQTHSFALGHHLRRALLRASAACWCGCCPKRKEPSCDRSQRRPRRRRARTKPEIWPLITPRTSPAAATSATPIR